MMIIGKEAKLQAMIIRWLKSQGCWVMKTRPGMGTPTGTADVFFCKEGFYGFAEFKGAKNAKFQPGQKEFIEKMNTWSWARVIYPENFEEVLAELKMMI